MKKILLLVPLLLIAFSCESVKPTNATQEGMETPAASVKSKLETYLDGFFASNPSWANNDITKSEASTMLAVDFLLTQLGDSINILADIPFKMQQLIMCNSDKYEVVFVYNNNYKRYGTKEQYQLWLTAVVAVDKEIAKLLIEGDEYYISGSCYEYAGVKSKFHGNYIYGNQTAVSINSSIGSMDATKVSIGVMVIENIKLMHIIK